MSIVHCRMVHDFSGLVQFVFFIYFTWSIGSICLTMFAIILELVELNFVCHCLVNFRNLQVRNEEFFPFQFQRGNTPDSNVFQNFFGLIWSFVLIFLSCEFGHKLSCAFNEIDFGIGQMYWYRCPAKVWKLLPMLMAFAQEPVFLRVFGSTSCARSDFKGVCVT